LAGAYKRVGEVLSAQGRPVEALTAFRDSLAIMERLAAADPSNTQWQWTSSLHIGDWPNAATSPRGAGH